MGNETFGVRPRTTSLLVFISDYVVSLPLQRLVASFGSAFVLPACAGASVGR